MSLQLSVGNRSARYPSTKSDYPHPLISRKKLVKEMKWRWVDLYVSFPFELFCYTTDVQDGDDDFKYMSDVMI